MMGVVGREDGMGGSSTKTWADAAARTAMAGEPGGSPAPPA